MHLRLFPFLLRWDGTAPTRIRLFFRQRLASIEAEITQRMKIGVGVNRSESLGSSRNVPIYGVGVGVGDGVGVGAAVGTGVAAGAPSRSLR